MSTVNSRSWLKSPTVESTPHPRSAAPFSPLHVFTRSTFFFGLQGCDTAEQDRQGRAIQPCLLAGFPVFEPIALVADAPRGSLDPAREIPGVRIRFSSWSWRSYGLKEPVVEGKSHRGDKAPPQAGRCSPNGICTAPGTTRPWACTQHSRAAGDKAAPAHPMDRIPVCPQGRRVRCPDRRAK
jgi:hypothetical protein